MAKPLTDGINALTRYANSVTGQSDTTLSEAVATLANGYGQGGSGNDDALLDGTLSGEYVNDTVTKLRPNAFTDQPNLTSVSLPSVTYVGNSALRQLGNLTSVNLPNVTSMGTFCFTNSSKLNNVSLPKLGIVNNNAFENCTSLTSIRLPLATQINNSGLRNCRFPTIVLPRVTKIDTYGISNNANLTAIDCSVLAQVTGGSAFINDTNLTTVVIRTSTMATNGNLNHFNNTPFASNGTGGTLYVPQDLISSYQSASNWSTILGYANNQILPIEGSIYETQYADGTPIE